MIRVPNYTYEALRDLFYDWQLSGRIVFDDFRVEEIYDNRLTLTAGPNKPGCLFLLQYETNHPEGDNQIRIYGDSEELERKLFDVLASDGTRPAGEYTIERCYDLLWPNTNEVDRTRRLEYVYPLWLNETNNSKLADVLESQHDISVSIDTIKRDVFLLATSHRLLKHMKTKVP